MNVIFNYTRSFCQIGIAIVVIFFLTSCAGKPDGAVQTGPLQIKPVYNALNLTTAETKPDGTVEPHLFFDPIPFDQEEKSAVNVIIATAANSKFSYALDTKTGALFRKQYNCKHEDVWGKFEDTLSVAPFSVAFVPRMLDALSQPQQAFVFGDPSLWGERSTTPIAHSVRVVGGLIRQVCRDYPCTTRERWLTNMQLLAVNTKDKRFADVYDIDQLKAKVDWEHVIAWAQNGFGVTLAGTKPEPVYRVTGEIKAKPALEYFYKKDRQIDFEEQKKMISSCNLLYENLWLGAVNVRNAVKEKSEAIAKGKEGTKSLIVEYSELEKLNLTREQREADLIDKRLDQRKRHQEANFAKFFSDFHAKHSRHYKTCMRFVRPASIVKDSKRFWFFAHIDLFMWLEELGWSYRCSRRAWLENPRKSNGQKTFENSLEKNCTTEELDDAFETAITVMSGERTAKRPHARFIAYDSGFGGSHQKIYSWVYDDGKELQCTDSDEISLLEKEKTQLFPSDIEWKSFNVERRRSRYDIIE